MHIEYISKKVVDYLAGDEFYKEPIETFGHYSGIDDFIDAIVADFVKYYEETNRNPNAWQELQKLYDTIGLYICEWLNALLREQGDEIEEYTNLEDEEKKEVLYGAHNIMLDIIKAQLIRKYEQQVDFKD